MKFHGIGKTKGDDDKDEHSDLDRDKGNEGKGLDLGKYDLSVDVPNCMTGRFRLAVDFAAVNISHETTFKINILDLLGRQIGKIEVNAKTSGKIQAKGKITLTQPAQTVIFRMVDNDDNGKSDKDKKKDSNEVIPDLSITGISLYAKGSQRGNKLASMIALATHGKTRMVILILCGVISIMALGIYWMMDRRRVVR